MKEVSGTRLSAWKRRPAVISTLIGLSVILTASGASVDHFAWGPIATPQQAGRPFVVSINAQSSDNQVVSNFTGNVSLAGTEGSGVVSLPLLGDLSYQAFSYAQNGSVSAGYSFTPNTDLTVTHVRAYSGGRISIWTDDGVLLAARDVSDFGGRWVETPLLVPLELSAGNTYRVTLWSGNYRYYWRNNSTTNFAHGIIGRSYSANVDVFPTSIVASRTWLVDLRYSVGSSNPVAVTPPLSGNFTNGTWSGNLAVQQAANGVFLTATDGAGHIGNSSVFTVSTTNDLDLSLAGPPGAFPVGDPLTYIIVVTNTGPSPATLTTVTNLLSGPASFVAATVSPGTFALSGKSLVWAVGTLGGGAAATATLSVMPTNTGLIALHSTVIRSEIDGSYDNNAASIATPILDRPAISIGNVTITEPDTDPTNALLLVQLTYPSSQTISVNYATANGTATAGTDYQATSGTLVFGSGMTAMTLAVPVLGDALSESNETFFVNLSNPTNATVARSQATVTIIDNDPLPSLSISDGSVLEGNSGTTNLLFVVTLSSPSGRTVTVAYQTTNGTALAGSDYIAKSGTLTFAPGVTNQTISIPVFGDIIGELNETVLVNLTNPVNATTARAQAVGTILNDDPITLSVDDAGVLESTSALYASFRVWLSPATPQPVVVSYYTSDGTALGGRDYLPASGALLFPPGVTTQTVQVVVLGNVLNESNETFYLNLTNALNATIAYGQAVCILTNNIPLPVFRVSSPAVLEGDTGQTNAVFQISLSAPSQQTLSANYATADGTATAGSDYVAQSGTLTFPPGVTNLSVSVPVLGDRLVEGNEVFYLVAGGATGVATIVNDDGLPGRLHHFEWSPIPSPQLTGLVFSATITAMDYSNAAVTNFTGPAFLFARTNSPTALLFQEDFEDGNLTGWSPSFITVDRYITNQFAAQGTNCLFLGYNPTSHSLSNLTPSRVNFYVRADTLSGYKGYFILGGSSASGGTVAFFEMAPGGQMGLFEDVNGFHSAPYLPNQWYRISLLLNWQNRTIDYLIDDTLIQSGIPFRDPTVASLTTLLLYGYAPCWYDQIEFLGTALVDALGIVSPQSADYFTNGVWIGNLTIAAPSTNLVLGITNNEGFVGFSNPFEVGYPDDLMISMGADRAFLYAGENLTCYITVASTGPDPLPNVIVTNTLPQGMLFVSATASQGTWSPNSQGVAWNVGTLLPGTNATLNLVAEPTTGGWLTNQAVAGFSGADPNLANNLTTVAALVLAPLHHFALSTLVATQQSVVPFPVTITARDPNNNLVSNFNGTVSLLATRLFKEDFEDGNLDGWNPAVDGSQILITNTLGGPNNNALSLNGSPGVSHDFPNLAPAQLSFKVRLAAPDGNIFCTVSSGPNESQRLIHFRMSAGVMYIYYAGGSGNYSHPFDTDRWYQIKFDFHWGAQTYDWYVDGALAASNVPFYGGDAALLANVSLYNWFASNSWWDDVELDGDPVANSVPVAPSTLGPFSNGVWFGPVTALQPVAGLQLRVADNLGHEGLSSTFSVKPGPHGVFDHFEWGPLSPQLVQQPFTVALTAKDSFGDTVTNFVGAPTLRAVQRRTVQLLVLATYADANYVRVPLNVISNYFQNFTATAITNTDVASLRSALLGKDVFLVPSQNYAPAGTMGALGTAWRDVLSEFVSRGGVVVVCCGNSEDQMLLDNSGLLACAAKGVGGLFSLTKSTNHILTDGIAVPFMATTTLRYFWNTNGTKVLEQAAGGDPIVLSSDLGSGHSVLFGSDLAYGYPSGTALDRVFANAIKWAQSSGLASLALSPTNTGPFVNGVWTGTLALSQPADSLFLQADDGHLNSVFSSSFSVGVTNDIAVTLALSDTLAVAGEPIHFLVTITNVGPAAATVVQLANALPPGVSLVAAAASQGTCSLVGSNVVCELGTLPGGVSADVTITLSTTQPGPLTNSAVVTRGEPDFFLGNNYATLITSVFPPPSFYVSNATVLEPDTGVTNALFQVTLYPPSAQTSSVSYATLDISAVAGADYVATNGVLIFPPGVTNAAIVVPVKGDLLSEDTETFLVRLFNPVGALLGTADGLGTILDNNDPLPLLSVDAAQAPEGDFGVSAMAFVARLSGSSGRHISVQYATADGTAVAGRDYYPESGTLEFAPGVTNALFYVSIQGNTVHEPDKFFLVNLFNVTNAILAYPQSSGVILDDDALPGKLDHFVVDVPSTPLVQGQPFGLAVRAQDSWNYALPQVNGAFRLTCLTDRSSNAVEVLYWTRCADSTRSPGTLTALSNWFSAFRITTTTNIDPEALEGLLLNKQVFLVPAQSCGSGYMAPFGTSWAALLNRFVNRGGIIIVCSDNYDEHLLLANSGLMQLTRLGYDFSGSVTQAASSCLLLGVSNSFNGPFVSTYAASNGVVVLKTVADGYAVVVQREIGPGAVFMIGGGFFSPGSQMDHVLANAVSWRYDPSPLPVMVTAATPLQFTAGNWNGKVTVWEPGTNLTLEALDDLGHIGLAAPLIVLKDTDGDGMPDDWETAHGLNPNDPSDAALDTDGDGMSNLAEFLAGTDPRDPASALSISSFRFDGTSLILTFLSAPGRRYAIEATDDLQAGRWNVVDDTLVGDGGLLGRVIVPPTPSNSFYRLRLLP